MHDKRFGLSKLKTTPANTCGDSHETTAGCSEAPINLTCLFTVWEEAGAPGGEATQARRHQHRTNSGSTSSPGLPLTARGEDPD